MNSILAVDDSTESLELLGRLLSTAGYRVRLADSGELALAAIELQPPDLILLDIQMPGLNGLQVCRTLKVGSKTRHIPIILLSGFADVKEWTEGLRVGADDFISKPFQNEELLCRVRTHLALAGIQVIKEQATSLRQSNAQLEAELTRRRALEIELRRSLEETEHARKAMQEALEDRKRYEEQALRWQRLFELSDFGLACANIETNTFLDVNAAFARERGYTREELIGSPIMEVHAPEARPAMMQRIPIIDREGHLVYETVHRRKDGTCFPVLMEVTVIKDEKGNPLSRVAYALDITKRKKAELELLESQERLQTAVFGAGLGTWHWDVTHDNLQWSKPCRTMLGVPSDSSVSYETFLKGVHPEDSERVNQTVKRALAERSNYDCEYRVVWQDGSVHWIAAKGRVHGDKDGTSLRMEGVIQEITQRKQMEQDLAKEQQRVRLAMDAAKAGTWNGN